MCLKRTTDLRSTDDDVICKWKDGERCEERKKERKDEESGLKTFFAGAGLGRGGSKVQGCTEVGCRFPRSNLGEVTFELPGIIR